MKKIINIMLFLSAFIMAGQANCSGQDAVKIEYTGCDMKGIERWQAGAETVKKEGNIYTLTEKGQGIYSSFKGPVSWEAQLEYEITDDTVIPGKLLKKVFDENGNMIRLEKQDYDHAKNSVICLHQEFPGDISVTKEFNFTKPAVNKLLLAPYVQKMLETGKDLSQVQMITEEPGFYDIDIKVLEKEEIEINGRKVNAVKLQFDPRLGLLNAAKVFFPKSYVWHSATPDFKWLRFQGLEGDINSVKVEVTVDK